MDDKNRTECGDSRSSEDELAGGPTPALLDLLIAQHPMLLSIDELARRSGKAPSAGAFPAGG